MKYLNKQDYKVFLGILAFVVLIFMQFSFTHFGLDSYAVKNLPASEHAGIYFASGRITMSLFILLMDFARISFVSMMKISYIIAILSLTTSIYLIDQHLAKRDIKRYQSLLLAFILILSPFIIELFFFPEYTGITCFSIYAATASSLKLHEYYETKKLSTLLISTGLFVLAITSYQSSAAYFIILFSLWQYTTKFKLSRYLIAFSIYGFGVAVSLFFVKLANSTRISHESFSKIDRLKEIIKEVIMIIQNDIYVFPPFVYQVTVISLFILAIISITKNKIQGRMLNFAVLIAFTLSLSFAPHLLTTVFEIPPRTIIGFGMLHAVLLAVIVFENKQKFIFKISCLLVIVLSILQVFYWQRITTNHFKVNIMDRYEVQALTHAIDEYQISSGNTVRYVIYLDDHKPSSSYKDISRFGGANLRIGFVSWAIIPAIENELSQRLHLGNSNINEHLLYEKDQYCKNNDWDWFDINQLSFDQETMFVCRY